MQPCTMLAGAALVHRNRSTMLPLAPLVAVARSLWLQALLLQLLPSTTGWDQNCDFAVVDDGREVADDASLFERRVRQQRPAALVGAAAHWPALAEWQPFERFARRYANLHLPVRKPVATARGQSFRRASRHVTVRQWAQRLQSGGNPPFVFDTNGSSGILPALGADIHPLPRGLTTVLRTSLFSLAGARARHSSAGSTLALIIMR